MEKPQCKNTNNSLKKNMATLEPSDSTRRLEHHNPEETKESNLNYNLIKVIGSLKELMKNSLKKLEGKPNKILREIKKSLKIKKAKKKQLNR